MSLVILIPMVGTYFWLKQIQFIMNPTNKIITAFLAGAAAGALLGVLFAPAKGSETRAKIQEQGQKLTDEFQDVVEKGKEKMQDLRNKMNEKFSKADMKEEEAAHSHFKN